MCSVTSTPRLRRRTFESAISAVLDDGEIVTSSELIKRLEAAGHSRVNARQILARASSSSALWRSDKLILESGGRLYALQSSWGELAFHNQARDILREVRPRLYRLLTVISEKTILRPAAEKILCCPYAKREGHRFPLFEDEVAGLVELGFLKWEDADTALGRLTYFRYAGEVEPRQMARALWAEQEVAAQLTRILADTLRRINLLTWGSLPAMTATPTLVPFNNYLFDHVGFSRMGPLHRFSKKALKPSPTPVVFEVLARECLLANVESFLERIQRAGANKTSRLPIVGIVAAPLFQKDAWARAKNEGLMCINLTDFFGQAALDVMIEVESLMQRIGTAEALRGENTGALAAKIASATGSPIVKDLRSLGFEVLAGLIVGTRGWQGVELNRQYPFKNPDNPNDTRELDVGAVRGAEEAYVIECKAEDPERALSTEYVRKFFCETVPSFVRAKFGDQTPKKVQAEIWTTGVIDERARAAFDGLKLAPYIERRLLDRAGIEAEIPRSIEGGRRLLATIALPAGASN